MEICFVTSNPHKVCEVKEILDRFNIEVKPLKSSYPEIQSESLLEIASYSSRYATEKYGRDVIVEDAGLFVEALNGFPGPYSAYVYETIGRMGVIKLLRGISRRDATFRSVVAFSRVDGETKTFTGETQGNISYEEKGRYGFAFDPIFIPTEGDGRTFAEMSMKEKNDISHRRRSFESFAMWVLERL